ncbi:MAG: glycosyltransferase family 4 protein, partial [Bdellovibrio sp.]
MNILYINHYAGSLRHGMEFRPAYLGKEWLRQGHRVRVVASSFSHLRRVQPSPVKSFEIESVEGVDYQWLKCPTYSGNGVGRVLNIFCFVLKLFFGQKNIVRGFVPDVVVASSTYPLDVIPAYFLARRHKAKLVHEVHDLWPLTLIELGGVSKYNPLVMLFQWAENFSYRNVDRVVSMLQKADHYMVEHGLDPKRFCYVPNGVFAEDWRNPEALNPQVSQKIAELKSRGFFILGYAGAHGVANALEFLMDAARRLVNDPIAIVMVGQGEQKPLLKKFAMKQGLRNVYFFESIPKLQIPVFLSEIDAAYIGWSRKSIYRFGINPNKILDYMMAGCPIVHSVTAGNDWVQEAGAGISVEAENSEKIAEAILCMSRVSLEERRIYGECGRKFVVERHL